MGELAERPYAAEQPFAAERQYAADRPPPRPGAAVAPGAAPYARAAAPPLPEWLIPRPRLVARLSRGVLGPLTVVVGPAGAGKTALVTEWAHTAVPPGPVAWVACDGGAEPPGVLWPRVAAQLGAAGVDLPFSGAGSGVSEAGPGGGPGGGPLSAALVADGLALRAEPVVLVLEDFEPEPGSATAEEVSLLLRHASPAVRLLVISRRDPPLHLHRRRLAGELAELRTVDLAFTEKETTALLAQHGVTLAAPAVRRLAQRTEGWAAGLRLAAMSLAGHRDPAEFVRRFAGDEEAVVSYLSEEVLDAQPPELRHQLLVISVLERVNAELAAAVAGQESQGLFAALVRQNSFLHPLGHGWYRCHRMFRDVLLLRLRHEAPGQIARLHRRAAAWLAAHGLLPEALSHALAAGDPRYAARLAVSGPAVGTLLGLTGERLPQELARELTRALAQGPTTDSAAEGLAQDTTAAPHPVRPEPEPALVAAALALGEGDAERCDRALREADAAFAALEALAEDGAEGEGVRGDEPSREGPGVAARLTRAVIRTEAERSRRPEEALAAAAEAEELGALLRPGPREAHPELGALVLCVRGDAELRRGRPKGAERAYLAALKALGPAGGGPLRRDCLVGLALLEALRGRMRSAADLAARAQSPAMPPPSPADRSRAALHAVCAWSALARGDAVRARPEIDRGEAALRALPDPPVAALLVTAGETVALCERGAPPTVEAVRGLCAAATGVWPAAPAQALERAVHLACAAVATAERQPRTGAGAASTPAPGRSVEGHEGRGAGRAGTLSGRERDVLAYLARTMTTEEIAAELYLSVNTVKTHLKSVYRKLEVTRRSAAVRRARELELL
ncbi:LuxR C-terminal-related transcriptional regulator [Streptomyces sp. ODS28]|uniref:LuxR C-terminal-related transcriptional regulator n=1 Tax=Streptomyces sp. ODS28 TaxID=3136688 RepID=UPI0031F0260F